MHRVSQGGVRWCSRRFLKDMCLQTERETLFVLLLFEFDVVLKSSRLAEVQFVCFIICPSILA